jgi:hypothetical protein
MPNITRIEVTKADLYAVIHEWESDNRAGGCLSESEALALPIEVRVQESVDYLWKELGELDLV